MQARVTVELQDNDEPQTISTLVNIPADIALIAQDDPRGALFYIFKHAEAQMVSDATAPENQEGNP